MLAPRLAVRPSHRRGAQPAGGRPGADLSRACRGRICTTGPRHLTSISGGLKSLPTANEPLLGCEFTAVRPPGRTGSDREPREPQSLVAQYLSSYICNKYRSPREAFHGPDRLLGLQLP